VCVGSQKHGIPGEKGGIAKAKPSPLVGAKAFLFSQHGMLYSITPGQNHGQIVPSDNSTTGGNPRNGQEKG